MHWDNRRDFCKQQLCSLMGDVLKSDFTYKIADKIAAYHPDTGRAFKPFKGFASVVNEAGQVVWYGVIIARTPSVNANITSKHCSLG